MRKRNMDDGTAGNDPGDEMPPLLLGDAPTAAGGAGHFAVGGRATACFRIAIIALAGGNSLPQTFLCVPCLSLAQSSNRT